MTTLFSSIGKYLALVLLLLLFRKSQANLFFRAITTDPTPATKAEIREFKLWIQYANAADYDVTDWKCQVCTNDTVGTRLIKTFPVSPTRNNGYVAINDKEKAIIVAYRGTTDEDAMRRDLQILQVPYSPSVPNAKVHQGFFGLYNETKKEILSLIKDLVKENSSYKVISTGFSLGGSLATLQTLDLINTPGLNPSNLFTYTFGEPRDGNKEFDQFIMNTGYKFFRLVDKEDMIPYLPTKSFNYTQYGPEYWINPNNEIVVCQNADDEHCSKSLPNKSLAAHGYYFDDLANM